MERRPWAPRGGREILPPSVYVWRFINDKSEKRTKMIKDVVAKEQKRDDLAACSKVYLYKEGRFLGAYEWSAWLLVRFGGELKVRHRKYKEIAGTVASVGFPSESMEKFLPAGSTVEQSGENELTAEIPAELLPSDYTPDMLHQDFETWKTSLPAAVPVGKQKVQKEAGGDAEPLTAGAADYAGLRAVMRQILAFNVNQSTPLQCMQFITQMQSQLAMVI